MCCGFQKLNKWQPNLRLTTDMDCKLADLQVWPLWKKRARLGVCTLTEDAATAGRAEEFCRCLTHELGSHCKLDERKWVVSELRMPPLRHIAAQEAAQAALLIICLHPGQALPAEVRSWFNVWLTQRGGQRVVLLALVSPAEKAEPSPLQLELAAIASKAHAEFLVEIVEVPVEW